MLHPPSQPCSPACAGGKIWDLSPNLYPEGLKALPNLHKSPPHTPSWKTLKQETSQQDPLPLWEAAGAEGIAQVHAPFFLTNLSQTETCLGSFSSDSDNYLKEFEYLI